MPNEAHMQAQELSVRAEMSERAGDSSQARELYLNAAGFERIAYEKIPADKPRTLGALAVSWLALLYKAKSPTVAPVAYSLLIREDLPRSAVIQIKDILASTWEDQELRDTGRELSEASIEVALKGPDIGSGSAPIGLIANSIDGINRLLYRITESLLDFPLRKRGRPRNTVLNACQAIVTEPQVGSFRFGLRLIDPLQLPMFREDRVRGNEIAKTTFHVLESVSSAPEITELPEMLKEYVPRPEYRRAMLQIVRNFVPDGREVKEMTFSLNNQGEIQSTTLFDFTRFSINQMLAVESHYEIHSDGEYREFNGILRAIHLDRDWLEIALDNDKTQRCEIIHEMLDDVVGPMVNRRVNVKGQWYSPSSRFDLLDIELSESVP